MGQLPAAFSSKAKMILRQIQGIPTRDVGFRSPNYGLSPLPPAELVDWIDRDLVGRGCFDVDDRDSYHAVELTVQRGFDLEMVPVWDMVNHDVRERVNVDIFGLRSPQGMRVFPLKPIAAGEELLYSYNYCNDCYDAGEDGGTPAIFRDFGFLEDYPQEWPFLDQNVYAVIRRIPEEEEEMGDGDDEEEDESSGHRFYATFSKERLPSGKVVTYAPSKADLNFFGQQLHRLQNLDIEEDLLKLPNSYERISIQKYYRALVIALSSILQAGIQLNLPFDIFES